MIIDIYAQSDNIDAFIWINGELLNVSDAKRLIELLKSIPLKIEDHDYLDSFDFDYYYKDDDEKWP